MQQAMKHCGRWPDAVPECCVPVACGRGTPGHCAGTARLTPAARQPPGHRVVVPVVQRLQPLACSAQCRVVRVENRVPKAGTPVYCTLHEQEARGFGTGVHAMTACGGAPRLRRDSLWASACRK
jgi:hypothetical protein